MAYLLYLLILAVKRKDFGRRKIRPYSL